MVEQFVEITRPPSPFQDARVFQILFQLILLGVGVGLRDFSIRGEQIAMTFAAGLLTQWIFVRTLRLKDVGFLSALITCLGISLLLRSDREWVHPLAVSVAIAAKFLLRVRGKHLFNPAMLGVVFALFALPGSWLSPGQWGSDLVLAIWVLALGGCVVWRSRSQPISWSFLICFAGLLLYRVIKFGYSIAVWEHQLQSGALLLFAFFMISDPKTTPNHRYGRWIHAAAVALLAYHWQFTWFFKNSLIWALFLMAPIVPILDWIFEARPFEWKNSLVESLVTNQNFMSHSKL